VGLFWAVTVVPWPLIGLQQWLPYNGGGEVLWPWWTVLALLHLVLLVLWLVVESRASERLRAPEAQPPPEEGASVGRGMLAGFLCAIFFAWAGTEIFLFARSLWFNPISSAEGDMLPLVERSLQEFWLNGAMPYRHYEIAYWTSYLTFLPGLWLPHSIPFLAGVDIRLWQVCSLGAVVILAGGYHAVTVVGERRTAGWVARAAVLLLPLFLFRMWGFSDFLTGMHVAGFWLLLVLWALAALGKRPLWAALIIGIALATRPHLAAIGPIYLIYTWRTWGEDRLLAVGIVFMAALGFLGLTVPFLAVDAKASLYGITTGYEWMHQYTIERDPASTHGFALTALLYQFDLYSWRMTLGLIAQVPIWALAIRYVRQGDDLVRFSAAGLFFFFAFLNIPYFYLFVSPLLLAMLVPPRFEPLAVPQWFAGWRGPAAAGGLCALLMALLIGVALYEPPERLWYRAPGDEDKLSELRLTHFGFEPREWQVNDGRIPAKIVGEHAYFALVKEKRDFRELVLDFRVARATPGLEIEVLLNSEFMGRLPLGEEGEISHRLGVPRGNVRQGGNHLLINVYMPDGEEAPESVEEIGIELLRGELVETYVGK